MTSQGKASQASGAGPGASDASLYLRLLGTQNWVLALIATGRPLAEVLGALVGAVEEGCPGTIASVLSLDDDRRHLRHAAAPRLPEAYNRAVDGLEIGPAVGSCGTAAYRGERVVVGDIAHDPLWADYRDIAERHGLRACWSQPIFSSKHKVLGTFAMYYGEPREPTDADFEFIETAAHLAGIAIERDRADRNRQETSRRLLTQGAVLVELAKSEQLAASDFQGFTRRATEASASTLGIERVGVWFFDEERSLLRCRDLYQISTDRHSAGVELNSEKYPRYFAALERGRVVAAHEARTDPDTSEFLESYLRPLGITSMLDAPVRKEGELVGVVCHEHVGPPRVWAAEEQDFAASVADFVSLALEASERRRVEQAFRVAQEELLRMQWQARRQVEHELERVKDELIHKTRLATIGQVATTIADELRNPLGAIRNAQSYLATRLANEPAKSRERLDLIGREVCVADTIIDNLLEMSRAKEPVRQTVDLGAVVREAFERVREARDVRLVLRLEPDPLRVEADPEQLRQLLVNTIKNAAQAMSGAGEIRVAATTEGGTANVTIADDGPGVPADTQARVFRQIAEFRLVLPPSPR